MKENVHNSSPSNLYCSLEDESDLFCVCQACFLISLIIDMREPLFISFFDSTKFHFVRLDSRLWTNAGRAVELIDRHSKRRYLSMLQSMPKPPKMRRRNGATDGRTDGRTDRPSYRGALSHLKMIASNSSFARRRCLMEWKGGYF